MRAQYKTTSLLIFFTLLGLALFFYLLHLKAIQLYSLQSLFLMMAWLGSFWLYVNYFFKHAGWRTYTLMTGLFISVLVSIGEINQHFSLLNLQIIFFGIWLGGLIHLSLASLLSSSHRANHILNHLLLYIAMPLFLVVSNYFLSRTGTIHPLVRDEYLMAMDGTLGIYPSLIMGHFFQTLPFFLKGIINFMYLALPLAFIIVYTEQLNLKKQPAYELIIEFILIGYLGIVLYPIIPGCGSQYAFSTTWPDSLPGHFFQTAPQLIPCPIQYPRNCLPSLHTAWVLCLLRKSGFCDPLTKILITCMAFCTLIAMFGIGAHYLTDIVVGLAFANCIGGMMATHLSWQQPARYQAILCGALLCIGWYLLILYGLPILQLSQGLAWFVFLTSILLSIRLEWALYQQSKASAAFERKFSVLEKKTLDLPVHAQY